MLQFLLPFIPSIASGVAKLFGGGDDKPKQPEIPLSPPADWLPPGTPGMIPEFGFPGSTTGVGGLPSGGGAGKPPSTPSVGGGGLGVPIGGGMKLTPQQIAAIAMVAQQFFGKGGQMDFAGMTKQNPQLGALLDLQMKQAQRQDPLHQAVTQLATNLMPNSAFGAGRNRPLIK